MKSAITLILIVFYGTQCLSFPRYSFNKNRVNYVPIDQSPRMDIPLVYNRKVQKWIKFKTTRGKRGFQIWLERSHRYLPRMKSILREYNLPDDLAYISLIESGLSAHAVSTAQAVGYWQFISATGQRYGLKKTWWLDERRDFYKSTKAAANYLRDLYKIFGSWYLTAAAYNMGETRLKRLIRKYGTTNFWSLAKQPDFPKETRAYIPKLIATILIAKNPKLYGFTNIEPMEPYAYEPYFAPGGTDLHGLASYIGFTAEHLRRLNPGLVKGFIPKIEKGYWIRIPKGHLNNVSRYIKTQI